MSEEHETRLSDALENQDGFVTPRYRSGQRTADALLESGRTLLAQISYEGLSVSELCKSAGLTTGAFYRRFESKDAFFLSLQRLALDDAERVTRVVTAQLDSDIGKDVALAQYAFEIVDAMRAWHSRNRGVLRASIQRRDHTAGGWQPFKEYAREFVEEVAVRLTRVPELLGRNDALPRLRIAFQIVLGTLINAALNEPGPLQLDEPEMTDALAQTLALYARA
ncbi:TetR/AcrR family transcriptional regulator [Paraburkholderia sediminicola]|uniref:TetR/AcrR family transcriptional regulator n=1 Tax=Paraburkholderia sediminicola TaxID=458836 RepID=UPI0038B6F3C3